MRKLGGTGVWASSLRFGDRGQITEAAAELEELGYSALWFPGGMGGDDVFSAAETLLTSTKTAAVATGVLNLWFHEADEVGSEHARLTATHGDRFLVGIGISHQLIVDADEPGRYEHPLQKTEAYLDALDAADQPLDAGHRVLAALGPKMLDLARRRATGAHPYNVTPEHTATAREALGPDGWLLPEQAVVLSEDADQARTTAREALDRYWGMPNYTNNLRRLGFGDDDFAGGGSDRIVDALVAWGSPEAIAARISQHRQAGADHVCIQVLTADPGLALWEWRELAPALKG